MIKTGYTNISEMLEQTTGMNESVSEDIKRYEGVIEDYQKVLEEINSRYNTDDLMKIVKENGLGKMAEKCVSKNKGNFSKAISELINNINYWIDYGKKELDEAKDKADKIPKIVNKIKSVLPGSTVKGNKIIVKSDNPHDDMYNITKILIDKLKIKSGGTDLIHKGSWTTLNARLDGVDIDISSTDSKNSVTVIVKD